MNRSRGRLIVRNVSYKANEELLEKHMSTYGKIKEVVILKNENGRMKGVAFVEYFTMENALAAIKDSNLKKFMGRPIAVDLAVPKQQYQKVPVKDEEVKTEIKTEPEDKFDITTSIKKDDDTDCDEAKSELGSDDDCESKSNGNDEDDLSDCTQELSSGEEDDSEFPPKKKIKADSSEPMKPKFSSSKDISEGKTLFIRNLFFDTSEETLEDVLSQYGKIKYVLLCKDKELNKSKGTAFAQFETVKECEAVLNAFGDPEQKQNFMIDGRQIIICKGLSRDQAKTSSKENKQKREANDKRNLYLAREGVIREGTRPAEGVSNLDLRKRVQREVAKRKMLANLNIFVSPMRLCIHNIPFTMSDRELLKSFQTFSPKGSVIKECRIMRNLHDLDEQGIPSSKGYGFVAFTQHEDALNALRTINNNPDVFTVKQRPIVEFSLENKAALKAKENRMKKSVEKNVHRKPARHSVTAESDEKSYMGVKFDPKRKGMKALMTHLGPKIRHKNNKKMNKASDKLERNKKTDDSNHPIGKITRNKLNHQSKKKRNKKRQVPKEKKHKKKLKKLSY